VGPVKAWHLQASVNGKWKELPGFDSVSTGDVIPLDVVYDEFLPRDGILHLFLNGAARECISTMYGKSIATDIRELGITEGVKCLSSIEHSPGQIDVHYSGPEFGVPIDDDDEELQALSVGGDGGSCSGSGAKPCVVDQDCPASHTCVRHGGSIALRYRMQRLHR
jgi:hypothetical protein